MRPYCQGKVDTFCAAYAVMNALQITHGIKPLQGRNLFTTLLLALARDETVFMRVLTLKTDYIAMTDAFLTLCSKEYPIKISQPFTTNEVSQEEFLSVLKSHLDPDNGKTAVFQFEKRLPLAPAPVFAHWTTAWKIEGENEFHLFDCSPEENSVKILYKDKFHMQRKPEIEGEYFCVNAHTLRLIERI